jgi:hypothetical protein
VWEGFRDYLEQEWPVIRAEGRGRFVWRHRVLPFGIPIGCFGIVWFFYLDGLGPAALLTREGASLAYYVMGVTVVVIYIYARIEWAERERHYFDSSHK